MSIKFISCFLFFYRKVGILCKDSASECNESLLSHCRVQPILCKDSDYKPNLQTYSHKKVFYSQFRCFFKHNNAGFQTRLLLIANKASFDCKQGFFSLQTRLVWKSKRAKNAKEQKIHWNTSSYNSLTKPATKRCGLLMSCSRKPSVKHLINHEMQT